MNTQVAAFLTRSLRQESRLTGHHVLRALLAGFVFSVFLIRVFAVSLRPGAGAAFATDVLRTCYWFVTLLGGMYFSTAIVEEKEEQTLPLLRMTGTTPAAILLGKSIPRLTSVLLFLLVVTPFLFLSVTLGGVLMHSMLMAVLGILTYAVMFSQIGLLTSVISGDAQRAAARALVIWGLLEFLPTWSWLISEWAMYMGEFRSVSAGRDYLESAAWHAGSWKAAICAWLTVTFSDFSVWVTPLTLQGNLYRYVYSFALDSIWQAQMTAHLILAVVFYGLSCLLPLRWPEPYIVRTTAS